MSEEYRNRMIYIYNIPYVKKAFNVILFDKIYADDFAIIPYFGKVTKKELINRVRDEKIGEILKAKNPKDILELIYILQNFKAVPKDSNPEVYNEINYYMINTNNKILERSDADLENIELTVSDSEILVCYILFSIYTFSGKKKHSAEEFLNTLAAEYIEKSKKINEEEIEKIIIIFLEEMPGFDQKKIETIKKKAKDDYINTIEKFNNIKYYLGDNLEEQDTSYYMYVSGIKVIKIVSVCSMLSTINTINDPDELYFRGHSNSAYKLSPSVSRFGWPKVEDIMYEESLIRNPEEYSEVKYHVDIIKKMQHYGIPTRLLDTTKNLLIALYMTVEIFSNKENSKTDGEVIVFRFKETKFTKSDTVSIISSLPTLKYSEKCVISVLSKMYETSLITTSEFNGYLTVKKLLHGVRLEKPVFPDFKSSDPFLKSYLVRTTQDNRRIIRQDGSFIICSLNYLFSDDLNKYRESNNRYIISRHNKEKIRSDLSIFGINNSTVYPEIEKVSEYIKDIYR